MSEESDTPAPTPETEESGTPAPDTEETATPAPDAEETATPAPDAEETDSPAPAPTATAIPETMKKAIVVEGGPTVKDCKIEIQQDAPVPKPGPNEILVKMVAAAVNPSDYGSWKLITEPNTAMGKEGSGIVVAIGGGLMTKARSIKIGQHVGIARPKNNQGTYSEYVIVTATDGLYPLPAEMPVEDGASFFVNPYTVLGILDTAKSMGSPALVHTAAASQVGQMMAKVSNSAHGNGVQVIHVVRREEQVKVLQDLGAMHIINSSQEDWKVTLKQTITDLKCTVAFDAVAGSLSGDILEALPAMGTLYVYGKLAGNCSGINPTELIYGKKQVKGFYLAEWAQQGGMIKTVPRMLSAGKKVNAGLIEGGWATTQSKDISLEDVQDETVKLLDGSVTGIKLRIRFDK